MMSGFDPSKMDPKVLMELSQLVRELPPEKIAKMQSLMHNMMGGFDVSKEMAEFEHSLPADFRQKLFTLMASQPLPPAQTVPLQTPSPSGELNLREARMTILRAVAERQMSPEEAEKLLFSQD